MNGKLDGAKGELKEHIGQATGDRGLETEGTLDRAKGKLEEGAGKAKDAVEDMKR
jgi:uncharacterized protein YjbJ (UPF0337 family)